MCVKKCIGVFRGNKFLRERRHGVYRELTGTRITRIFLAVFFIKRFHTWVDGGQEISLKGENGDEVIGHRKWKSVINVVFEIPSVSGVDLAVAMSIL